MWNQETEDMLISLVQEQFKPFLLGHSNINCFPTISIKCEFSYEIRGQLPSPTLWQF